MVADPESTAERIAKSGVRADLVTALDDWAILEPDEAVRDRVLAASPEDWPYQGEIQCLDGAKV